LVEHLTVVGKKRLSADIRVSPVQVRERGPFTRHQLMYIPDEIDTSGLLSKSGSGDQYHIINRLRTLLVDLSNETLRRIFLFALVLITIRTFTRRTSNYKSKGG
jgi:ribosomal 50S subunit-associated protein YjgA (DUF615 family)